jgi:hypothetical protein
VEARVTVPGEAAVDELREGRRNAHAHVADLVRLDRLLDMQEILRRFGSSNGSAPVSI